MTTATATPTRVWPKPIVHIYESSSRGREGTVYRVLAWHGVYECDCPARVECKHIRAQREADLEDLAYLQEIRAMTTIEERGLVPAGQTLPEQYRPLRATALVTAEDMETLKNIAATVMKAGAGMVPDTIKTPEAALAVMLAGREMGVPPFRALDLIYPVNGKMKMMTELMVALVEQRDPTARFVFHNIGFDGADIELFRRGASRIRITYTDAERKRAHLGMTKVGSAGEKWVPIRVNGEVQKYPATNRDGTKHPKAGQTRYEQNPDYDPKKVEWVEDTESNWYMYPAEHMTWMALKRCIRFGASDLVNLTPMEMTFFDEDDIPVGESSRAVFGTGLTGLGEADERREDEDDGPPDEESPPDDYDDAPPHDDTDAQAVRDVTNLPEVTEVPAQPARTPAELREGLERLMKDTSESFGAGWLQVFAELAQFMPNGERFDPKTVADDRLQAVIAFLRTKRGDPVD